MSKISVFSKKYLIPNLRNWCVYTLLGNYFLILTLTLNCADILRIFRWFEAVNGASSRRYVNLNVTEHNILPILVSTTIFYATWSINLAQNFLYIDSQAAKSIFSLTLSLRQFIFCSSASQTVVWRFLDRVCKNTVNF
jgi:hypothetical protein